MTILKFTSGKDIQPNYKIERGYFKNLVSVVKKEKQFPIKIGIKESIEGFEKTLGNVDSLDNSTFADYNKLNLELGEESENTIYNSKDKIISGLEGESFSNIDIEPKENSFYIKTYKKKKYDPSLQKLKIKISNYAEKELSKILTGPSDTPLYVAVTGRKQLLVSYPTSTLRRIRRGTRVANKELKDRFYKKEKHRNLYAKYYYPFVWNEKSLRFQKISRRKKWKTIRVEERYNLVTNKNSLDRRLPSKSSQLTNSNYGLVFGFLSRIDAEFYMKKAMLENRVRYTDYWGTLFWGRQKKQRHRAFTEVGLRVRPSTIKSFYEMEKENKIPRKGKKADNIFILVPRFFKYKRIQGKGKRKFKGLVNFPQKMLSKQGFEGIPVYKTKPVERKVFKPEPAVYEKYLKRYEKYFKVKKIFITLNKEEYEFFAKRDKKNLIFYKDEKEFVDTFTNVSNERRELYLEQVQNLLDNVNKKLRKTKDIISTMNFVEKNYDDPYLLEKTSYYIRKVKKRQLFTL